MRSKIDPYVKTPTGRKFVGGAAAVRRMATSRKGTRILRPGEKDKSQEVLPKGLSAYERFFAALLRSEASEYVDGKQSCDLWKTICRRVKLKAPEQAVLPTYFDQKNHFAIRATLVLEEARHAIASGLYVFQRTEENSKNHNCGKKQRGGQRRQARPNQLQVLLKGIQLQAKTEHSVLSFTKERTPFTLDELSCLRPGTVIACFRPGYKATIDNVILGCILPTNREEMVSSKAFSVMIFRKLTASTDTIWELRAITSLIAEHRKFDACTCDTKTVVPFLHALLGGKEATHLKFPEAEDNEENFGAREQSIENMIKDDSGHNSQDAIKEEDRGDEVSGDNSESSCMIEAQPSINEPFRLPRLNASQEQAARTFLNSDPNTITLIQGPPGTGKTTLLVSIICNHLMKTPERCLMVCAPTNKAVSVLCTRFLNAINCDDFNVLLLGDDTKLLDDEQSRFGEGVVPSNLRSVFLYTWTRNVLDDLGMIQRFLARKHQTENERRLTYDRAKRLVKRLRNNLLGTSSDIMEALGKICDYLKIANPENEGKSHLMIVKISDELIKHVKDWRNDHVWEELVCSAHIIFCTLASAGVSVLKKSAIEISDLIVDEAAASTEPELYIPFYLGPQRLLAVGDPKQLPATVLSQRAMKLGLSKSLHERLMYDCNKRHIMLDVQYRMKPEVSQFPSNHFYEGKLVNAASVVSPQYVGESRLLGGRPYTFLQVNGTERQGRDGSYENEAEANAVVGLVHELLHVSQRVSGKWHSADRIRVITFYQAQVTLLKRLLYNHRLREVVVATVDSSQGCEADIVIVSFVRSNSDSEKARIGFLSDDRRMNVALTRAKYQLICVGNAIAMTKMSKAATVQRLASDAMERDCLLPLPSHFGRQHQGKRKDARQLGQKKKAKRRRKNGYETSGRTGKRTKLIEKDATDGKSSVRPHQEIQESTKRNKGAVEKYGETFPKSSREERTVEHPGTNPCDFESIGEDKGYDRATNAAVITEAVEANIETNGVDTTVINQIHKRPIVQKNSDKSVHPDRLFGTNSRGAKQAVLNDKFPSSSNDWYVNRSSCAAETALIDQDAIKNVSAAMTTKNRPAAGVYFDEI